VVNDVNSDPTVVPAPQAFRFDAPVGWIPVAITGTVAAVRLDVGADSFSPNVLISVERTSMSREEAIGAQSSAIAALDSVAMLDELDLSATSSEWHAWEYAYTDKRAGTLVQLFALAIVSQPESRQIVTLVGSVDAKRAEDLLPAIRSVLRSVNFL
jgi:hypothetical protein